MMRSISDILSNPRVYIQERLRLMPNRISIEQTIPDVQLTGFGKSGKPENFSTLEALSGKKVVLITMPGAFTKVCSQEHLTGYVKWAKFIKEDLGVNTIACASVDKLDVMRGWSQKHDPEDQILMLPDLHGIFTLGLGLGMDRTDTPDGEPRGLGLVAMRSVMILSSGVVKYMDVDENAGLCVKSSAETIVKILQSKGF